MKPIHYLYALLVALCWGGNFVAAKLALEHFPTFLLLGLRFALVALLLLPFTWKRSLPFGFVVLMSVILGNIHFALSYAGIAMGLDLPTAIIAIQMGVPFSCMFSAIFFNDKLGAWRTAGMVVALLGIMLIAGTPNVVSHFVPFLITVGAAFCWAVTNVMMKKNGAINNLELLAWMSLLASPQLFFLSYLFEANQWELIRTVTLVAGLSVTFSAVCSTVVAYGLWYYLLRRYDVTQIAPFNLLVPVIGITLSHLLINEPLNMTVLVGGAITITGVAIIVVRRPRLSILGKIVKKRSAT